MSSNHNKAGPNFVPAYQMSGIPYATASIRIDSSTVTEVEFNTITKFVTVVNEHSGSSAKLRVGFSSAGTANTNHFILDNGESYTGEFRITSLYLLSDTASTQTSASIVAGLTGIQTKELPANWSGSVGVG